MQGMRVSASQPAAAVAALRGKAGWPAHLRPLGLASAVGGQRLRDCLAHELELAQRRRHHGAADLLRAGGGRAVSSGASRQRRTWAGHSPSAPAGGSSSSGAAQGSSTAARPARRRSRQAGWRRCGVGWPWTAMGDWHWTAMGEKSWRTSPRPCGAVMKQVSARPSCCGPSSAGSEGAEGDWRLAATIAPRRDSSPIGLPAHPW